MMNRTARFIIFVSLLLTFKCETTTDHSLKAGEEYYTYTDCPGFEFTNNYYISALETKLSCEVPRVGETCVMSLHGFVNRDFFVDYLHVLGKYQGITVMNLKKEMQEFYGAGSFYTRELGAPTTFPGLISGTVTSYDNFGLAIQCYKFQYAVQKALPTIE